MGSFYPVLQAFRAVALAALPAYLVARLAIPGERRDQKVTVAVVLITVPEAKLETAHGGLVEEP